MLRGTILMVSLSSPFQAIPLNKLVQWADASGLGDGQWLGYMWDDPEIVPHEKCRYDVGLEVPAVIPGGEVGRI